MFSSPLYIFDAFTQKQIFPFGYQEQKDLLHKNRLYRRETAGSGHIRRLSVYFLLKCWRDPIAIKLR